MQTANLDVDMTLIKPFIEGVVETFKVQVGVKTTFGKPYLKNNSQTTKGLKVAGLVGIMSERLKGSLALVFPESTYLKYMSKLLGEEFTTLTPDLFDGAGELVNIVFGYGKRVLNDMGSDFQMAIPSVVVGDALIIHRSEMYSVLVLPFESEFGTFDLEIGINSK